MDAGNDIGPEGVASLVPALEKMPQLTSLYLGSARIGLSETGALGGFSCWVLFGCAVRWGLVCG
jgi:hypothetical protein